MQLKSTMGYLYIPTILTKIKKRNPDHSVLCIRIIYIYGPCHAIIAIP